MIRRRSSPYAPGENSTSTMHRQLLRGRRRSICARPSLPSPNERLLPTSQFYDYFETFGEKLTKTKKSKKEKKAAWGPDPEKSWAPRAASQVGPNCWMKSQSAAHDLIIAAARPGLGRRRGLCHAAIVWVEEGVSYRGGHSQLPWAANPLPRRPVEKTATSFAYNLLLWGRHMACPAAIRRRRLFGFLVFAWRRGSSAPRRFCGNRREGL